MIHARRLFGLVALLALVSPLAERAYAATTNYSGTFAADNTVFTTSFASASNQIYNFSTSSFAAGGFTPVLTLFSATGGNPIAFAETGVSDVSFSSQLAPGNYILALSEDPNVFTTNYAAGTLFASNPTITGDLCGVSGGTFLNLIDCSQHTGNYAFAISSTAVTPEPSTWLLVMPAVALLFVSRYRRQTV